MSAMPRDSLVTREGKYFVTFFLFKCHTWLLTSLKHRVREKSAMLSRERERSAMLWRQREVHHVVTSKREVRHFVTSNERDPPCCDVKERNLPCCDVKRERSVMWLQREKSAMLWRQRGNLSCCNVKEGDRHVVTSRSGNPPRCDVMPFWFISTMTYKVGGGSDLRSSSAKTEAFFKTRSALLLYCNDVIWSLSVDVNLFCVFSN